jgi:hypothetical protein
MAEGNPTLSGQSVCTHCNPEIICWETGKCRMDVMPHMRHFVGCIMKVKDQCVVNNKPGAKLSRTHCDDFILMQRFLQKARDIISMNLMIHRAPDVWMWSNTSEDGLGGMHVRQAVGWRWLIPDKWRFHLTLNTLEFLGAVVGIWVDIIQDRVPVPGCILAELDSTTTTGWLHKSNFVDEDKHAVFRITRKLGEILLEANACLYSQWFAGALNTGTDSPCLGTSTSRRMV